MNYSLEHIQKIYHSWGRHPLWYASACSITFLGQENKLRKLAIRKLDLIKGDTVLDLACGTGLNHRFLEDAVGPSGKIIAFDYSNDMLVAAKQRAKKHNWNNVIYIQGDAANLVLNTEVDGVLSTLGMSAIPEHIGALKKATDALKDHKKISILDAQLPSGFVGMFNPLIAAVYKHWAGWDYTKDIPEDLRQVMSNVKIESYNGGTIYIAHGTKNASKENETIHKKHMFQSLESVIIYVHDIEKSKMFYQKQLGFTIERDEGSYVVLRVNPNDMTSLAINLASASGGSPEKQTIVLGTSDIDKTYQELQAQKATILAGLQNESWGKTFTFADVDGNRIEVIETETPDVC
jgi:demethylmenaquinone methyltransferase/2-methoxy-6-polyprenyl-1,4-benzoquinol methylase